LYVFNRQPWNHYYYQFLDGAIPPTAEPWTATTAVKTVIDQFVQAPIFTVLIFTFLGFLEGKNAEVIKQQLEDDYKDTMIANCKSSVGTVMDAVLPSIKSRQSLC
jgi:peroxisomal membrane protein 2